VKSVFSLRGVEWFEWGRYAKNAQPAPLIGLTMCTRTNAIDATVNAQLLNSPSQKICKDGNSWQSNISTHEQSRKTALNSLNSGNDLLLLSKLLAHP
jgi:hypothetical protein